MDKSAGRRGFPMFAIATAAAVLAAVTTMAAAGYARAATEAPAPFVGYTKYVRYKVDYQVNANGTHVETWDTALKVLSRQGISDANQTSITYSQHLQTVRILYAYTLKPGGHRIDVPPSNFQEQINRGKGKAMPMFSDLRTLTVAFPQVATGDTVVLGYKLIQKKATFPGNFSFMQTFSKFVAYDDAQVSMSAPAALKIQVEARGVKGGEIAAKDGRRNWRWTYHNEKIAAQESASVSSIDYGPMIVASTFKDYGGLAHAYELRAAPKAAPDAQIRNLADRLTRGDHTTRDQAAALYEWVATNIDYAGDYVGVGMVVPHEAQTVLANRMGDCKDHATLFMALLAAKKIKATSVLINGSNAYTLPEVPAIQVFDHVITYIPALKQYADTTSRFTPFGDLPVGDSDKPVIYTDAYDGVQHTPPTNWRNASWVSTTELTYKADGSAHGGSQFKVGGPFATSTRASFHYLQPNLEGQAVRASLAEVGFSGTGKLKFGNPLKPTDHYDWSATFKLVDALNLPGPGAFPLRDPLQSGNAVSRFISSGFDPPRTVNFSCMGVYAREIYTIHLPPSVKVLAIPSDVDFSGYRAHYRATYHLSGDTVTATRVLKDETPGNVCTPQDAARYKPFALRVMKDLRAQVLYK